jgi:hypothetical protein
MQTTNFKLQEMANFSISSVFQPIGKETGKFASNKEG